MCISPRLDKDGSKTNSGIKFFNLFSRLVNSFSQFCSLAPWAGGKKVTELLFFFFFLANSFNFSELLDYSDLYIYIYLITFLSNLGLSCSSMPSLSLSLQRLSMKRVPVKFSSLQLIFSPKSEFRQAIFQKPSKGLLKKIRIQALPATHAHENCELEGTKQTQDILLINVHTC